jgi:hypothetical protein
MEMVYPKRLEALETLITFVFLVIEAIIASSVSSLVSFSAAYLILNFFVLAFSIQGRRLEECSANDNITSSSFFNQEQTLSAIIFKLSVALAVKIICFSSLTPIKEATSFLVSFILRLT